MASKQQIRSYAAQSKFIFTGKVIKLKAATLDGIDPGNTAVVQVDQVVAAPPAFTSLSGQQVTVRFKSLAGITKGSAMTFFTNGWIYGASLALDAVASIKEMEKMPVAALVREGHSSDQDSVVKRRLDSAALVVAGKVTQVEPSTKGSTHISEHDPDWHEATIDVDETIKGQKGTGKVTVLFPKSDDIRWHKINKYQEGQQGIFLLQQGKQQDSKGIAPKVFATIPKESGVLTTLHAADFLPLHELGRVKSLLKK